MESIYNISSVSSYSSSLPSLIRVSSSEFSKYRANASRAFADPNNTDALNFSETDIICPGKTFCTEVPNYLERTQLHKVSGEKFAQFKMYFRDDYTELSAMSLAHYTQLEEEDYCDSQTQLEYPKSAQTKDSKWVLVVQYGDNKQGISMEQCV
ncbi:protein spaetzle-like [Anastrepha ludens]|uniref:protein spaetzle-like n=1 Tax=Anastrepha ludens TaxID=28586 RepID=UPI0023B18A1A|nr:protein spaetzle-like [Anastrepha ludens]